MRKKIFTAIIFMSIVSLFLSIFSIECIAQPPHAPTDFTTTTMSKTRIDLSWTMGINADITWIERNTTYPWSFGQGRMIFFGIGTSWSDTAELSEDTHYYYQAWSGNLNEEYSNDFTSADNTTFANQAPKFESPSPFNSSINNPLSLTWSIPIYDLDGDAFSWTIQCSNGQANSGINDADGIKSLSLSGLAYSTIYTVWVNATDTAGSNLYTKEWYTFATNQKPTFGSPTPANSSINIPLNLTWNIPINDPDGDAFSWSIQCSNGQTNSSTGVANGTKSLSLSGLAYSTIYTVWVNATDTAGSNLYTKEWYTFATNQKPTFGSPTPANSSINIPLNLTWNIPINDLDGDEFSWTIQCSNGQTASGAYEINGIKSLTLTGLTYSTTYTILVNATDPTGSGLHSRKWYTFTTNQQPIFGSPIPSNGSTNTPLSLNWNIPINDPDKDAFSWTIQCSNGQFNSGTNDINGTKSLNISGLTNSKPYKIWVNASDPTGSNLTTRKWYTFTTKSSGGGGGNEPPVQPENKKPIANTSAGEPYQGYINSVITFDGSRSTDPDGTITKWFWVFGDNTSGSGKIISHTFSKAGTYTVTLTVTDNDNATNTDTTTCMISEINNRSPINPIVTGTKNGPKNTIYTYTAVSSDPDNDRIQYTFDWGDPLSLSQSSGFLPSGISFTANHSWSSAGRYDVTVTVTDNQTESSSTITVYIDAVLTGDMGYLIDNNGDGIYDTFYSDVSKRITVVQKEDANYNIDSDGNGEWDYTFDATHRLIPYQESNTPGFEIILVVCAITVILLWRRKRNNCD